jgi:hypothetical protein
MSNPDERGFTRNQEFVAAAIQENVEFYQNQINQMFRHQEQMFDSLEEK